MEVESWSHEGDQRRRSDQVHYSFLREFNYIYLLKKEFMTGEDEGRLKLGGGRNHFEKWSERGENFWLEWGWRIWNSFLHLSRSPAADDEREGARWAAQELKELEAAQELGDLLRLATELRLWDEFAARDIPQPRLKALQFNTDVH